MSITVDTITHEILSDFFRHGRYLRNWGPRTVETYDLILSSAVGISLTKAGLTAHVVTLRERGLAMATVLSYRNAHRDLAALCHAAGVQRGQTNPHAFRHCFAVLLRAQRRGSLPAVRAVAASARDR